MKRKRLDILRSKMAQWIKVMKFSSFDKNTQDYLIKEMIFFNNRRFGIFAIIVLILEIMNILIVVFLSKSGLGTAHNRLYFTMYLILFVSAILCLAVRYYLRNKLIVLQKFYVGFTFIWVIWHAVLTSIDLRRNPNMMVFVTGILAISLLSRIKPIEMFTTLSAGLVTLFICAGNTISYGNMLNAIVVSVAAMLIYSSRHLSMVDELGYRQKMILQNAHNVKDKAKLAFILMQQHALLEHSSELLYVWDKVENTFTLSNGRNLSKQSEKEIMSLLLNGSDANHKFITLKMEGNEKSYQYEINSTYQFDSENMILGAVGNLKPRKNIRTIQNERKIK